MLIALNTSVFSMKNPKPYPHPELDNFQIVA
jgi:hypothetical protein